jgi:hypothetical protein
MLSQCRNSLQIEGSAAATISAAVSHRTRKSLNDKHLEWWWRSSNCDPAAGTLYALLKLHSIRFDMKLPLTAILLLGPMADAVLAVPIALWTFETNTPPDLDNATTQSSVADEGIGSGTAVHASAATDWRSPAGNGSLNSWSSNNWAAGDYYQFQVSTLGLENILISWEQTRSDTGPSAFRLLYGTDGLTWTNFAQYIVGAVTWSSGSHTAGPPFSYDLTAATGLNNQASVYFRLEATSAGSSAAGTSRIDDVTITGTEQATAVPEGPPGIAGLAGALGLMAVMRRRWWRLG